MNLLTKSLFGMICVLLVFQVRSVVYGGNFDNAIIYVGHLLVLSYVSITFLCWVYQINKRLRIKYASTMKFTPGWSVGWFFVPIAFLWKQYQVLNEIWRMSQAGSSSGLAIVGWWHGIYIVSNQLSWRVVMNQLRSEGETPRAATTENVSSILDVVLSLVTILLVYRISTNTKKSLHP